MSSQYVTINRGNRPGRTPKAGQRHPPHPSGFNDMDLEESQKTSQNHPLHGTLHGPSLY